MPKLAAGLMLVAQLSGPGGALPQVLHPDFRSMRPVKTGEKAELTLSFSLLEGYAINRTPPMNLKVTAIPGVILVKTDFTTASEDPKSKDEYYVDLPTIQMPVMIQKAGKFEIPGKLTYFFCSKADGFCSRQVLDVKIPVTAE